MKLKMGKSMQTFKDCIGLATKLHDELPMKLDETGIHILAMDPSHVAMTDMIIKGELFDVYELPESKQENIMINIKDLMKFLDRLGKDEEITIETKDDAKLHITAAKEKSRRRFEVALLDFGEDEVPQPKIFFKAQADLTSPAVKREIANAGLVGEHVRVTVEKEKVCLRSTGDMGTFESEWEKGSDELLDLKLEEESSATYTLSFFNDLIGAIAPLSDKVKLEISSDMPLKMSFDTGRIVCALYLAPCIGV